MMGLKENRSKKKITAKNKTPKVKIFWFLKRYLTFYLIDNTNNDEINIFSLYSEEEIENFRCIFEMFDKDKSGFIEIGDLQTIMRSLGRDPHEAIEII